MYKSSAMRDDHIYKHPLLRIRVIHQATNRIKNHMEIRTHLPNVPRSGIIEYHRVNI